MRLILLALLLQLTDLLTFSMGVPYLMHGRIYEANPLMVAAFAAAGLAGVATLKVALIGVSFLLLRPLAAKYRPTALKMVAVGGAIGTTANLVALGALLLG